MAKTVELTLTGTEPFMMKIKDDGQGFDPQADFPGHLGLQSMRERVKGFGGIFEINSVKGQGTCIEVRIAD